jgi:hypothetical protein
MTQTIYGSTVLSLDLGRFFSFFIFYTVGRTPWTGDQPVARPLPAHRRIQKHNKRKLTSMPEVVFEPTIPVFERAKTAHALDRAATVIGHDSDCIYENKCKCGYVLAGSTETIGQNPGVE